MRNSIFVTSMLAVTLFVLAGSGEVMARDGERGHDPRGGGPDRPYVGSPMRQGDFGHHHRRPAFVHGRGHHQRYRGWPHRHFEHRHPRRHHAEHGYVYRSRGWGHHDHPRYAPRWHAPRIEDGRWLFGLFYLD